jgi:TPR repeat protein
VQGFKYTLFAADKGLSHAQYIIAHGYHQGSLGVKIDFVKAMEYYEKALKQKHPLAALNMAFMFRAGQGVPRDCVHAIDIMKSIADSQSCCKSMGVIAEMYYMGDGVPVDKSLAVKYWHRAADLGYPSAQYHIDKWMKICSNCGIKDVTLLNCSKCTKVRYCSRDCQKEDWNAKPNGHRKYCNES